MLIIRQDQWDRLQSVGEAAFERRLAEAMEALFPEEAARLQRHDDGRENFRRYLRQGVTRASKAGIEDEDDHAVFVALMLINRQLRSGRMGDDRKFLSWVRHIFRCDATAGHIKIARIDRRLQRQARRSPLAGAICETIAELREQF